MQGGEILEYAYLGLFQKVFEWVLSKILDPVIRFVSNLLTTVLSWLFEEVLAPILFPVLKDALQFFVDLWMLIYSRFIYLLFSGILKLIDYLEKAFDVFIGLENVTYTVDGHKISGTLVEVLMQQKAVSTAFWALTLGALGLSLLLTIYATAKSAFDLDFENKRPVSKVLAAMMKTFIQFFTVPFFVFFLLKLSAVILKGITGVLGFGGQTTLGRIVFVIASLDASKTEGYNISNPGNGIKIGVTDAERAPFYNITGTDLKDYGRLMDVDEAFYLQDFDYLIGFIAAIFLLFTIGICLIIFVQRVFEICLLYLASPYFVCMIPLDDGEKFSRWREMFVGKCFTGFGSVVGMRLFLMICPIIMGNDITFGNEASPEMTYMIKLFFIAGGAWAVYKSGPMITSLISSQAGSAEASTAATVGGMLYAYTAGKMISKGQQLLRSPLGGTTREKQDKEGQGGKNDQKGKFDGKGRKNPAASRGIPGRAGAGGWRPGYAGYGRPGYPGYGMSGYGRPGYPGYGRAGYGMPGYGRPGYPGLGRPGYGRPGAWPNTRPGQGRPGAASAKPGAASDPWESQASSGGTSSKIAEEKKGSASAARAGRARALSAPPAPGRGLVRPQGGMQRPGAQRAPYRPGMQRRSPYAYYRSPYGYGYYRGPYGRRPMVQGRPGASQTPGTASAPGTYAPPSVDRFAAAAARGGKTAPAAPGRYAPQVWGRYAPQAPGTYAPPSVDVFAAAAARGGKAARPYQMGMAYPYGSPYGSYRMNWRGCGYTFNPAGSAVSRSFPGSAVRSGAEIIRSGPSGSASGSQTLSSYQGLSDLDAGSAGSSGGVSGSGAGSTNAQIGGNARRYQVSAAVRGVSSPGAQVKYSDIGIRGISHNGGAGGRQFTRRNSR